MYVNETKYDYSKCINTCDYFIIINKNNHKETIDKKMSKMCKFF